MNTGTPSCNTHENLKILVLAAADETDGQTDDDPVRWDRKPKGTV